MNGHCRHCNTNCCAEPELGHFDSDEHAYWDAGHCPACAEAVRIADAIESRRGLMTPDMMPVPTAIATYLEALTDAAKIARGET